MALLEDRFGDVDGPWEAMRRSEARHQSDSETLAEYERALRTLYSEAWSGIESGQNGADLKRRFEDDVFSIELSQYLRVHTRDCTFNQTVENARIYASAVEHAKPKKAVRIVVEPAAETNHITTTAPPVVDFTPILQKLDAVMNIVAQERKGDQPADAVAQPFRSRSGAA